MVDRLRGTTMSARREDHDAWCGREVYWRDGRIYERFSRDEEYKCTPADLVGTDWEVCDGGQWELVTH